MPAAQRVRAPQLHKALLTLAARSDRDEAEQTALSIIRDTGQQLKTAGAALERAAEHLKNAGRGVQANEAKLASVAALQAAEGLVAS